MSAAELRPTAARAGLTEHVLALTAAVGIIHRDCSCRPWLTWCGKHCATARSPPAQPSSWLAAASSCTAAAGLRAPNGTQCSTPAGVLLLLLLLLLPAVPAPSPSPPPAPSSPLATYPILLLLLLLLLPVLSSCSVRCKTTRPVWVGLDVPGDNTPVTAARFRSGRQSPQSRAVSSLLVWPGNVGPMTAELAMFILTSPIAAGYLFAMNSTARPNRRWLTAEVGIIHRDCSCKP